MKPSQIILPCYLALITNQTEPATLTILSFNIPDFLNGISKLYRFNELLTLFHVHIFTHKILLFCVLNFYLI